MTDKKGIDFVIICFLFCYYLCFIWFLIYPTYLMHRAGRDINGTSSRSRETTSLIKSCVRIVAPGVRAGNGLIKSWIIFTTSSGKVCFPIFLRAIRFFMRAILFFCLPDILVFILRVSP